VTVNLIHTRVVRFTLRNIQRPAIHVWCTKFAHGRESIVDKERPGRHVVATTDATISTVDAFVRSDRHVSISEIVQHTGISRDSVHRIIRNHLKFRKVSARWVPKQLKPEQQAMQMMTSLDNLQCYKTEGEAMLDRIVTSDETWVHHYNRRQSRLQGNGNTNNRRLRPSSGT